MDRVRRPGALEDQVRFDREWNALRAYAAERGVRLIGDVPIYVAPGGADHRTWPELFRPGLQAGVPPDAYTAKGQLWGNPIFDWPALHRRRYRWWVERLRRTFAMVDMTRIDHFRGFVAYWAVPEGARDAVGGRWIRGPGAALFRAAERELGELDVIAEDLGVITEPVERLRRSLGFPGMVVLQFGFEDDPSSTHHPDNHERAQRRLHRHARPRHGARLVGDARRTRVVRTRTGRSSAPASRPTTRGGRSSGSPTRRPRSWRWCSCRTSSGSGRRRA